MTRKFTITNNACWFAVGQGPNGKSQGSRRALFEMIRDSPGITSTDIEARWTFQPVSPRSRLKELLDAKHLRIERAADLFGNGN